MQVIQLDHGERDWLRAVFRDRWGGEPIVGRGRLRELAELTALAATGEEGSRLGVATYALEGPEAELVTLDAFVEGIGVGRALISAVAESARAGGCRRLLVMTTNDNLRALELYQRVGFHIEAVRPGAVAAARALKPCIPERAPNGIPISDEIDLVMAL
jgi:ribosomal protein S18 acetylase RimI-like enzyme